jgi:mono/diheme cytochrome c family protein
MLKFVSGLIPIFFLLASTLASAGTSTVAGDDKAAGLQLKLGQADFTTYCAACHGVDGRGDGTVAEYLTIDAADLTQLKKKNGGLFPGERIAGVIDGRAQVKVHGPRDMPVWGDWFKFEAESSKNGKGVSDVVVHERIASLVHYIESIQEN